MFSEVGKGSDPDVEVNDCRAFTEGDRVRSSSVLEVENDSCEAE